MRTIHILLMITTILILCMCSNDSGSHQISKEEIYVIPQPDSISYENGYFLFSEGIKFSVDNKSKDAADLFIEMISLPISFCIETELEESSHPTGIDARIDNSLNGLGEEGYKLKVSNNQIQIRAFHTKGLFYAFQTLRQLFPVEVFSQKSSEKKEWKIPCVTIIDKPEFAWRGLMIDCSRTFWNKEFIKNYIDILAFYKLNVLHLHLTDDQGWRIEIKKHPDLMKKGAKFPAKYNEPKEQQGYYSQKDIKELIQYALERNITIVPEIEMPGHTLAALAVYPELSCMGGPFEIHPFFQGPGIHKDILCAGNENTFQFLEDVLDEVIELFPSEYIHIGGDEAPKERWEKCPKCQMRIKNENLHNEHELQSYFISRIEKYINSKGRKLIGWDEILEGGIAPNAAIMYWRTWENKAIRTAINDGHPIVMSPTSHCYFDYDVKTISMEKVYSFNPVPKDLPAEQAGLILGGQGNIWTHIARNDSAIDAQVFPRLIALAEVLWTKTEQKDFNEFQKRIDIHYPILREFGIQYGYEAELLTFKNSLDTTLKKALIELHSGIREAEIRFTTDGSQPKLESQLYKKPIALQNSKTIKAQVFKNGKPYGSEQKKQFTQHLAIGKKVYLSHPYSKKYTAGGKFGLVDGINGSVDFVARGWQGFQGEHFEAVIDLGEVKKVNKINISFLNNLKSWIFPPVNIDFSVSTDGENFQYIKTMDYSVRKDFETVEVIDFSALLENQKAQFVKIYAENIITCPDWHAGAGGRAWLFVDEVIIE